MSIGVSVGSALAAARREAGMSVEQVSAATRIRRTIVTAIENDDFRLCGGDFYARAHIRSIANAVHADPAAVLALYDRADAGGDSRRTGSVADPVVREPLVRSRGEGPNWSAAMAVALVLVLAVGGYRVVAGGDDPASRPAAGVTTKSVAPPAPSASAPRGTPRPAPSDAVAQGRRGVNVQLRAESGASWVSITNGAGRQLFQGLLPRGATKTVTDPAKVRLVVGNAGAVILVVNGKSVGAPGRAGSVARVEFGPDDPAAG